MYKPPGWHTVTTRIVVDDPEGLIAFMKRVFEATGEYNENAPAQIAIGDTIVMVSESGAREPSPGFLYVYVADADATYQRALDAGAAGIEAPLDTPYGDRRAMVSDSFGNTWQVATYRPQRS